MNEAVRVICNRRSVRQYKAKQITDADLTQILDAALSAPNAMNQQKWHFTVVQDKVMLERMVAIIKENMINSGNELLATRASVPGYNTFHNAPTVILISADEKARFVQIDCGAAAQNIALAAESLFLGSCIITSSAHLFASAKGEELKKKLGIPGGYSHICTVALGYKEGANPVAPPRNDNVINYIK
ncbi:MAG: nitroreductase family protein [Dehalococcoidia bacterium]|jgi:nitroreductase